MKSVFEFVYIFVENILQTIRHVIVTCGTLLLLSPRYHEYSDEILVRGLSLTAACRHGNSVHSDLYVNI